MATNVAELAAAWDQSGHPTVGGGTFNELHKRLCSLEHTHFAQYLPTFGADYPDFQRRLELWLDSADDEDDQRLLLEFAPEITFFTREDFAKLYQAALAGPIIRWVIGQQGGMLSDPAALDFASEAIQNTTWYCPMSDSMAIADFHHSNHLGGINLRPDWRSLVQFSERDRITTFMNKEYDPPLERIVVLEDFIGAGWQLAEKLRKETTPGGDVLHNVVSFAGSLAPVSFLFVPLVICPEGAMELRRLTALYPNVSCEPVLELGKAEFINPDSTPEPGSIFERILDLVARTYGKVDGAGGDNPLYGAYGSGNTGARVVMYSNTPANTLPIVQHRSDTWTPLFPRSARIR